jgi:hypothetical protein
MSLKDIVNKVKQKVTGKDEFGFKDPAKSEGDFYIRTEAFNFILKSRFVSKDEAMEHAKKINQNCEILEKVGKEYIKVGEYAEVKPNY